jgi:ankyrin repeat protein
MDIHWLYTKIIICLQGSVMAVEFLLLNCAKINVQDADGKTPLHLATELGKNLQGVSEIVL